MAKYLSEFIANLNSVGGVSRTNYFAVEIATPQSLRGKVQKARQFTLLCEGTNLPGINIGVEDRHMPHGFGVTQRMPWGLTFTDTNFSFYADNKGIISSLLTEWVNSIVKFNHEEINDNEGYLVSYRSRYATTITIRHLDQRHNTIVQYKLFDAYPGSIYDQAMNWSDTNSSNKIVVRMLFTRWTVEHFKLNLNDAAALADVNVRVKESLGSRITDEIARSVERQVSTVATSVVSNIGARFIENVQQAIPLLSGRSLGNIRF